MLKKIDVSIVIPFYNEEENVLDLFSELFQTIKKINQVFEIIAVNDGSIDKTQNQLDSLSQKLTIPKNLANLTLLENRKNFGQTAAIAAGIDQAQGMITILMDGDGQNDPADLSKLIDKFNEGFDLVSGWRKNRQDRVLSRKIPSVIANNIISQISGLRLHDTGCSLKAYNTKILKEISLYGENHRYLPLLLANVGARITEIPVNHRPRTKGESKYNISRTYKVILDVFLLKFFTSYKDRPIRYFGGWGLISLFIGLAICLYLTVLKLGFGAQIANRPLLLLGVLLIIIGLQFLFMGILAEIMIRIYYESNQKKTYYLKKINRQDF